MPQLVKNIK
uniref:Uncharacterized protein n=1 Tax=Anguilla anguilla TaxID=7936 RepID=A0A0E9UEV0_ANGAN